MIINIDKNVFIVIVAQILLAVALFYKKPSSIIQFRWFC